MNENRISSRINGPVGLKESNHFLRLQSSVDTISSLNEVHVHGTLDSIRPGLRGLGRWDDVSVKPHGLIDLIVFPFTNLTG